MIGIEVGVRAKEANEDAEYLVREGAEDGGSGFAFGGEAGGKGAQERIEAFGDEGRHVESLAEVGVAFAREAGRSLGLTGLPAPRGDTSPGAE